MTSDEILAAMAEIRQRTIGIYKDIAGLVDAESVGWKVREPGAVDVTLELLRKVMREAPDGARPLLRQIADNDTETVRLTRILIGDEEGR